MALPSTLLVFIFISLIPPSFCCPVDQKQALLQFKSHIFKASISNSSADSSLFGLDSWNSTNPDCCTWDRVVCDSSSRAVIARHLDSINPQLFLEPKLLSPEVLTPLFHIRTLILLDISFNTITGEVPGDGFWNLTKLVHLDMMQNSFHGSIPPRLFRLRFLQYLDLSGNSLDGILSAQVGFLGNLKELNLDENFFHGKIPEVIGNLTKLQHLSLRQNDFHGEIPSSQLKPNQLQVLDLSNNSLSMVIPPNIGNLSKISTLALSKNDFTGGIPPSIRNMSKLETLKLENNMLTGEIPSWLFTIKKLRNLFLGGKLPNLEYQCKNCATVHVISTLSEVLWPCR